MTINIWSCGFIRTMRMNSHLLLFCALFSSSVFAEPLKSLDDLIKQVRNDSVLQNRELAKREQVFLNARNNQAAMLRTLNSMFQFLIVTFVKC